MAHKLNFNSNTEKYSFMSTKEKAWHNLGQIVDQYPTSGEAIKHAGLDYTVEKRPLFTLDTLNHSGLTDLIIPELKVPNFFATVRSDTDQFLGIVGNEYEIVQNKDAFSFFDAIVGGGDGILYETAGALGNGERIAVEMLDGAADPCRRALGRRLGRCRQRPQRGDRQEQQRYATHR